MAIGLRKATKAALPIVLMAALAIAFVPTPVAGTTGTLIITTDTTLAEDHNGDIVIAADNITLDCAGYNVTGSGSGFGVSLDGRTGVTVKNCHVTDFTYSLYLSLSNNNTFTGNNASDSIRGISLGLSNNNTFTGNNASGSSQGISLGFSSNNTLIGNNASGSFQGIHISFSSSNNTLIGNNASGNVQGIYLQFSDNNTLIGNNASSGNTGILLSSSDNNTLTSNNASWNDASGIIVDSSDNNTLTGNNASSNALSGFDISDSNNNTLIGNNASSSRYGIDLSYSNSNTLIGNNASDNVDGIILAFSSNNTLTGNNASSSSIGIGIILSVSNNNTLTGNNASSSRSGIHLSFSDGNVLTENTVSSNSDYGIRLNSSGNTIHHNDFIENAIQAVVVSPHDNTWSNASGGNYWSDYTGVDADGDGIGDTPYAIPEGNQDDFPLMRPWDAPPQPPASVPSAPQDLQAAAGDDQVTLTWNPPSDDGGSAITGYNIHRGTSSGGETFLTTVGNVLVYTDTSATNGVTHYYQVSAVNTVGEGPRSNEASATPMVPDTPPPGFPISTEVVMIAVVGVIAAAAVGVALLLWRRRAAGK